MIKTELSQFGLTQEQHDYCKKREHVLPGRLAGIFTVLGILYFGLIFYRETISRRESIITTIAAFLFFGLIAGGACGFFVGGVIGMGFYVIRKRLSPLYKRYEKYCSAKTAYEIWWARNQKEYWLSLKGLRFEAELARLYAQLRFKVQLTPRTADKGIDIFMNKDNKSIIVQCKSHAKPVGPHVVRDLYGTLTSAGADEAILASVSGFTTGVKEFVIGKPIKLLPLEEIIEMQRKIL